MQLRELDLIAEQLHQQGVALHFITAEPGGDDEVKKRLSDRGTSIQSPVHSDPEHRLLLPDRGAAADSHSLYIKKHFVASRFGGTYEDYVMVQPALVVVHRSGAIQQTWSWNTEPLANLKGKDDTAPVRTFGGAMLVSIRPISADLGPSIKQNRQVALDGKRTHRILSEIVASRSSSIFKRFQKLRLGG